VGIVENGAGELADSTDAVTKARWHDRMSNWGYFAAYLQGLTNIDIVYRIIYLEIKWIQQVYGQIIHATFIGDAKPSRNH